MKLPRFSTLFLVVAAVLSAALLFWTSQSVQQGEDRLAWLERSVVKEQKTIRVLDTEWDYLNRPDYIESLAVRYLDMSLPSVSQIVTKPDILQPPEFVVAPARKPVNKVTFSVQPSAAVFSSQETVSLSPIQSKASITAPVPPSMPEALSASGEGSGNFQSLLDTLTEKEAP